jgi:hypothetical protein
MINTKEVWENRKLIYSGIINYFRKQEYIREIAKLRKEECVKCEYISKECSLGISECCSLCGCSIDFKTHSPKATCPHPTDTKWYPITD